MNRTSKPFQTPLISPSFIRKIKLIMKAMSSEKLYAMLLFSVIFIGVLILPPTVTSLVSSSVLIRSSGTIASTGNATSGSIEDIQAAIDWVTATGGGTVYIPEGTFTFDASGTRRVNINVPAGGIQIIGAGIDKTVLQMPVDDSAPSTRMFSVNGLSGGKVRISGITFKGRPNRDTSDTGDTGISIRSCTDFRVDHCSFWDMGGSGVSVHDAENTYGTYGGDINKVSQGVVDHCEFHRIYKPATHAAGNGYGYAVVVNRAWSYLWAVPNLYPEDPWTIFGKYYKNTYIEDCYFEGSRHAVCGNWAGAYVLRYSTIEDNMVYDSVTTGHPVRLSVMGMFAQEIYNVTVRNRGTYVSKHLGFWIKGGSSLMYNNTIIDIKDQAFGVGTYEHYNEEFYPLGNTKETYIWNNEIINGGGLAIVTYLDTPVEGTDFFTDLTGKYTTEQIQTMIDAKGYQPYTYPHPLTLQEFP